MKFDRVMVPIDSSTMSEVAVDLAITSAGVFATHLSFVYVVDVTEYNKFGTVDSTMAAFKLKTEGKMALDLAAEKAEKAKLDYECIMIEGVPWEELARMTKEQDMVIMGVTGKTGIGHGARIGSTAAKLIENSYCPVLTLKSGSRKLETILLPVSDKNMAAIDVAIETAKRVDGSITVFAVKGGKLSNPEALVKEVADKCYEAGVKVDTKIGTGNPADAIAGQSGMYDLVIMGTAGRQGLKKILGGGSVAEMVVIHSSCPVTIVRDF